jgi:hypothetical protein
MNATSAAIAIAVHYQSSTKENTNERDKSSTGTTYEARHHRRPVLLVVLLAEAGGIVALQLEQLLEMLQTCHESQRT